MAIEPRLTRQQEMMLEVCKAHLKEVGLDNEFVTEFRGFMQYKNNAVKFGRWLANFILKLSGLAAAIAVLWSYLPWSHKS